MSGASAPPAKGPTQYTPGWPSAGKPRPGRRLERGSWQPPVNGLPNSAAAATEQPNRPRPSRRNWHPGRSSVVAKNVNTRSIVSEPSISMPAARVSPLARSGVPSATARQISSPEPPRAADTQRHRRRPTGRRSRSAISNRPNLRVTQRPMRHSRIEDGRRRCGPGR